MLHPSSLHCCALSITKQHQSAPVAGGTSLKSCISQVFQNGSARNRCQLRHRHILFSLCKDCGQTIPSAPSCRQHCPIMKTLLLPRNLLHCIILITPFQLCSQSALSYWSQLLLHPTWQTAKHIPRGPSLCPLHLPAHPSLLTCCCSPPPLHSSVFSIYSPIIFFFFGEAPSSLFNWHPEHPCFIWYLALPPCRATMPG